MTRFEKDISNTGWYLAPRESVEKFDLDVLELRSVLTHDNISKSREVVFVEVEAR